MSLLVVGSVAFDAVETPHGKVDRMLGGAATYFSVAASFFTHVNLVGVVGEDFTARDEAIFRGRRIDIAGLERASGKTFFWAGKYGSDPNDRVTLATELNVFATFQPKLPEKFRKPTPRFPGQYRPNAAAFRPGSDLGQAAHSGARHHELLDRAHARRNCAKF